VIGLCNVPIGMKMAIAKVLDVDPSRPGQSRIIVRLNNYPCVVPLVTGDGGGWFLKTIIPSRKARKEGRKEGRI